MGRRLEAHPEGPGFRSGRCLGNDRKGIERALEIRRRAARMRPRACARARLTPRYPVIAWPLGPGSRSARASALATLARDTRTSCPEQASATDLGFTRDRRCKMCKSGKPDLHARAKIRGRGAPRRLRDPTLAMEIAWRGWHTGRLRGSETRARPWQHASGTSHCP